MSAPSDPDAASLRHEYEALSQEATTLASTLARRRADVALMRAEAATVAVSLEAAKEQLDTALRKEAVIRSHAQHAPHSEGAHADFLPDQGLLRSLAGQLEVTRESVKVAVQKRASLRGEIHDLESEVGLRGSRDDTLGLRPSTRGTPDERPTLASAPRIGGVPDEGNTEEGNIEPQPLPKRRPSSRQSAEHNLLQVLKESSESRSSFRFDHARIWRDVTMPNLALVQQDPSLAPSDFSLGVVTERIFEGITCFTPTAASKKEANELSKDLRIESCGELSSAPETISELLADHFSVLETKGRDEGPAVRFVAPKLALNRVMDLISDQDGDVAKRKRPLPYVDPDEQAFANLSIAKPADGKLANVRPPDPKQAHADPVEIVSELGSSSLGRRSPHRGRTPRYSIRIAPRLSNPSQVLSEEQFAQIITEGVPARFQESALELVYSTDEHGMSLHTLYHKANKISPTLVAIRDTRNRVFGCYAAQPWKSSATRYYGSGESFVFGAPKPTTVAVYKWSRENSFFQFTSSTFLAIGGGAGSHFALWIDEDLLMGTTSTCSTFASPPLTDTSHENEASCNEFKILSLEVWSFVAHRKH